MKGYFAGFSKGASRRNKRTTIRCGSAWTEPDRRMCDGEGRKKETSDSLKKVLGSVKPDRTEKSCGVSTKKAPARIDEVGARAVKIKPGLAA